MGRYRARRAPPYGRHRRHSARAGVSWPDGFSSPSTSSSTAARFASKASRRTRRCSLAARYRAGRAAKRAAPRATAARAPSALVESNARGRAHYRAINSCIALLPMVAGREVVTVEGLAHGRRAAPGAGGDGGALRLAVRLLHAGLRRLDVRGLLPRRPATARRGRSTISSAATSAAAPATGRSATR